MNEQEAELQGRWRSNLYTTGDDQEGKTAVVQTWYLRLYSKKIF